jgi:hypothetical protein
MEIHLDWTLETLSLMRQIYGWMCTCTTDLAFTLPRWYDIFRSTVTTLAAIYEDDTSSFSAGYYYYTTSFSCYITTNYCNIHVSVTHLSISAPFSHLSEIILPGVTFRTSRLLFACGVDVAYSP